MRKSPARLVVSLVLTLGAFGCSDGGGGGPGTGGAGGSSAGRGGTGGGTAGTGGGTAGTGGGTAGTGGGTAGTGGGTAGTGGGAAGTGGASAGTGGATAGSGGATGGSGGATAGSGGATAGTGGGTAGSGGATAGNGGATAGTGGGTAGSGGATGGSGGTAGGGVPAPIPALTGTATRPQLQAGTEHTILKYFEKNGSLLTGLTTDNWNPVAGVGDVATFTANFTVAASGGTHTTVQAALDAAVALGGSTRVYIKVNPGTYRETVCLKGTPTPPPITLYGEAAATTIIVNGAHAGKMYVDATTQPAWNPCAATNPPAAAANYGTSGSATAAFYARDFQAKNLTFSNDFDETGITSNIQAVALMTQNDKQIYESVRVLGHQDSLYVKSGNTGQVARNYFKNCYVEGDTDFIFGRGTFVLDTCEIKYLSARRGGGGYIVSPSTDFRNAYGLLIINSMLTAEAGAPAASVYLGRAWDEGNSSGYPTIDANQGYPNGQVLITGSMLGAHIIAASPWAAAATSARAYSSVAVGAIPGNRLWEYQNTGAGAAP